MDIWHSPIANAGTKQYEHIKMEIGSENCPLISINVVYCTHMCVLGFRLSIVHRPSFLIWKNINLIRKLIYLVHVPLTLYTVHCPAFNVWHLWSYKIFSSLNRKKNSAQIDWMKFERSRNQTFIRPPNFEPWYFRFIHICQHKYKWVPYIKGQTLGNIKRYYYLQWKHTEYRIPKTWSKIPRIIQNIIKSMKVIQMFDKPLFHWRR